MSLGDALVTDMDTTGGVKTAVGMARDVDGDGKTPLALKSLCMDRFKQQDPKALDWGDI